MLVLHVRFCALNQSEWVMLMHQLAGLAARLEAQRPPTLAGGPNIASETSKICTTEIDRELRHSHLGGLSMYYKKRLHMTQLKAESCYCIQSCNN